MENNLNFKKIIPLLYAGFLILFIIGMSQLLYNYCFILNFKYLDKLITIEQIHRDTNNLLSKGIIFLLCSFLFVILFLFSAPLFKVICKEKNEKRDNGIIIVESISCLTILVMIVLLITLLPQFEQIIENGTYNGHEYYKRYSDYEFAMQGQAMLIMPIITISGILIIQIYYLVRRILGFLKTRKKKATENI